MYKNIFLAFVVIFFVTGLTVFISYFLIKTAYPRKDTKCFILCPFFGGDRECCVKVSCIVSILSVLGLTERCGIILADCGMDKKEKELLYASFSSYPQIEFCRQEEISGLLCKNNQ